jgi:LmbE family N-acetylglucosaminyl deacetylase
MTPHDDAIAGLGTILSMWAHPDDETYLAGGVMAAAVDRGQRVVCVSATAGERGTADPVGWPPERLGRVRRWEAAAALAVLGVAEHRFLGLPDGELDRHEDQGIAAAGRLLDEVRPDTVLTFGPDGVTFHPDHVAVHRWITTAWRDRNRPCRLLYATPILEQLSRLRGAAASGQLSMTGEQPTGMPQEGLTLHLRLAGAQLDRKLTALRAMTTQTAETVAAFGDDTYAAYVAEEGFVEAPGVAQPPDVRPSPARHRSSARSSSGQAMVAAGPAA